MLRKGPRSLVYSALMLCGAARPAVAQDEQAARLADALSSGRWNPTAQRAYADLALARARAACGARVPAAFWEWLAQTPRVRAVVEWATAADPSGTASARSSTPGCGRSSADGYVTE
jgi:hypothetical protein